MAFSSHRTYLHPQPALPVDPFPSLPPVAGPATESATSHQPIRVPYRGSVHCGTKDEPLTQGPPVIPSAPLAASAPLERMPSKSLREWVQVTAYQPVDVVTRTVEVPVTRTVDVIVPRPVIQEKIVEVPKYIPKYIEKVVEVPQIEYVERVVEVPEVVYNTKYVPKVEVRENIIEKPVYQEKWVEKVVEVTVVEEVVRYRSVFEPEEIIKYIPRGHDEEEWRGAPIFTVPPQRTPDLPPKWAGTPQPSPRNPLVRAANRRVKTDGLQSGCGVFDDCARNNAEAPKNSHRLSTLMR